MAERGHLLRKLVPLLVAPLLVAATGCTAQQVYGSTKGLRLEDCQRLAGAEREDCLSRARMTYPEHEKQSR